MKKIFGLFMLCMTMKLNNLRTKYNRLLEGVIRLLYAYWYHFFSNRVLCASASN